MEESIGSIFKAKIRTILEALDNVADVKRANKNHEVTLEGYAQQVTALEAKAAALEAKVAELSKVSTHVAEMRGEIASAHARVAEVASAATRRPRRSMRNSAM
jgi:ABC-type transporter Mla subunit MlaD